MVVSEVDGDGIHLHKGADFKREFQSGNHHSALVFPGAIQVERCSEWRVGITETHSGISHFSEQGIFHTRFADDHFDQGV